MTLTQKLRSWVAAGGGVIGEVAIVELDDGAGYRLTHVDDREAGSADLKAYSESADARAIARYDEAGEFRPLKSAPGLRAGWELHVAGAAGLHAALDDFYPGVVGTWFCNQDKAIGAVPLREVLGRQTGMYRFANNLSDSGAQAMVAKFCGAQGGCLKRVCWPLAPGQPLDSLPEGELERQPLVAGEMPMLCVEGCNWLVAKARVASADEFQATQNN